MKRRPAKNEQALESAYNKYGLKVAITFMSGQVKLDVYSNGQDPAALKHQQYWVSNEQFADEYIPEYLKQDEFTIEDKEFLDAWRNA